MLRPATEVMLRDFLVPSRHLLRRWTEFKPRNIMWHAKASVMLIVLRILSLISKLTINLVEFLLFWKWGTNMCIACRAFESRSKKYILIWQEETNKIEMDVCWLKMLSSSSNLKYKFRFRNWFCNFEGYNYSQRVRSRCLLSFCTFLSLCVVRESLKQIMKGQYHTSE